MSKEINALDGFEFLTGALTGRSSSSTGAANDYQIVDPKEITGRDDEPDNDDVDDNGDADNTIINPTNTVTTDDEPVDKSKPSNDVATDVDDMEEDVAELLQEKLFAGFGWEIEEDNKFKSVNDIVDFVKQVVDENSKPEYANEEVAKLDEYVRNGGDITKFIEATSEVTNLENMDLKNPNNQKAVIRELLKTKGYTESRIEKSIDRYDDAGVLEEEAEDAIELLKEYKQENKEKLLKEQAEYDKTIKEQKRLYIQSVEDSINKVDAIRGVTISKAEKAKLMDYIFKPTSDGTTQYQKDYAKNNLNLIEAAYFTMKGDSLVQQVQQKANSEAARRLKEKLAEKGKRVKDQTNQDNGGSGLWSIASGQLRKPF